MRTSGFHCQRTSNELREAIDLIEPSLIVSLDHDAGFWQKVRDVYDSIFLIGRLYEHGQHWLDIPARIWAEDCARLNMPYHAWYTFNEPPQVDNSITPDLAARHDDWCCEFRRHILRFGYEAVGPNVATGNWHKDAIVRYLPNWCQEARYISDHEYSARVMWDQDPKKRRDPRDVPQDEGDHIGYWYCERYVDWYDAIIQKWPERVGQFEMVVSECGITMHVIPGWGDVGWQGNISEQLYRESLIWYFTRMTQRRYCLGGAIFQVEGNPDWASFETLPYVHWLLDVPQVGAPPPPPPPPASPLPELLQQVGGHHLAIGDLQRQIKKEAKWTSR